MFKLATGRLEIGSQIFSISNVVRNLGPNYCKFGISDNAITQITKANEIVGLYIGL